MSISEDTECRFLVQWLRRQQGVIMFTHIKNEHYAKKQRWKSIQDMLLGVSKGTPDYLVVTVKGIVFIEMKRKKGSVTRESQKAWQKALVEYGKVPAVVCKGFEEAKAFLLPYVQC